MVVLHLESYFDVDACQFCLSVYFRLVIDDSPTVTQMKWFSSLSLVLMFVIQIWQLKRVIPRHMKPFYPKESLDSQVKD